MADFNYLNEKSGETSQSSFLNKRLQKKSNDQQQQGKPVLSNNQNSSVLENLKKTDPQFRHAMRSYLIVDALKSSKHSLDKMSKSGTVASKQNIGGAGTVLDEKKQFHRLLKMTDSSQQDLEKSGQTARVEDSGLMRSVQKNPSPQKNISNSSYKNNLDMYSEQKQLQKSSADYNSPTLRNFQKLISPNYNRAFATINDQIKEVVGQRIDTENILRKSSKMLQNDLSFNSRRSLSPEKLLLSKNMQQLQNKEKENSLKKSSKKKSTENDSKMRMVVQVPSPTFSEHNVHTAHVVPLEMKQENFNGRVEIEHHTKHQILNRQRSYDGVDTHIPLNQAAQNHYISSADSNEASPQHQILKANQYREPHGHSKGTLGSQKVQLKQMKQHMGKMALTNYPSHKKPLDHLVKVSGATAKQGAVSRRVSGLNRDLSLGPDGIEDPYIQSASISQYLANARNQSAFQHDIQQLAQQPKENNEMKSTLPMKDDSEHGKQQSFNVKSNNTVTRHHVFLPKTSVEQDTHSNKQRKKLNETETHFPSQINMNSIEKQAYRTSQSDQFFHGHSKQIIADLEKFRKMDLAQSVGLNDDDKHQDRLIDQLEEVIAAGRRLQAMGNKSTDNSLMMSNTARTRSLQRVYQVFQKFQQFGNRNTAFNKVNLPFQLDLPDNTSAFLRKNHHTQNVNSPQASSPQRLTLPNLRKYKGLNDSRENLDKLVKKEKQIIQEQMRKFMAAKPSRSALNRSLGNPIPPGTKGHHHNTLQTHTVSRAHHQAQNINLKQKLRLIKSMEGADYEEWQRGVRAVRDQSLGWRRRQGKVGASADFGGNGSKFNLMCSQQETDFSQNKQSAEAGLKNDVQRIDKIKQLRQSQAQGSTPLDFLSGQLTEEDLIDEFKAQNLENVVNTRKLNSVKYRHFLWTQALQEQMEKAWTSGGYGSAQPEVSDKGVGRKSISQAITSEPSRDGSSTQQRMQSLADALNQYQSSLIADSALTEGYQQNKIHSKSKMNNNRSVMDPTSIIKQNNTGFPQVQISPQFPAANSVSEQLQSGLSQKHGARKTSGKQNTQMNFQSQQSKLVIEQQSKYQPLMKQEQLQISSSKVLDQKESLIESRSHIMPHVPSSTKAQVQVPLSSKPPNQNIQVWNESKQDNLTRKGTQFRKRMETMSARSSLLNSSGARSESNDYLKQSPNVDSDSKDENDISQLLPTPVARNKQQVIAFSRKNQEQPNYSKPTNASLAARVKNNKERVRGANAAQQRRVSHSRNSDRAAQKQKDKYQFQIQLEHKPSSRETSVLKDATSINTNALDSKKLDQQTKDNIFGQQQQDRPKKSQTFNQIQDEGDYDQEEQNLGQNSRQRPEPGHPAYGYDKLKFDGVSEESGDGLDRQNYQKSEIKSLSTQSPQQIGASALANHTHFNHDMNNLFFSRVAENT